VLLFSDLGIRALTGYVKKNYPPPTRLGEAVRLVARIGGYLDRGNGPPPGHQLIWRGLTRLMFICEGISLCDGGCA